MDNIKRFETISDYNAFNNNETLHPLVSIVDFSKASPRQGALMYFGFYTVILKDVKCGDLVYGRHTYDYQEGTLVFIAPGQVAGVNSRRETFHLSERERKTVLDCFSKIEYELQHATDKHSKKLIVSNIELFLNYCTRFYDRQFIMRDNVHKGILARFEHLLNGYFTGENPQVIGLPSVAYCAGELNISPNYFGDLVKKETGKTAQEYIQCKVIDVAKERIFDQSKSINQVAYELGFKYPQHFTRLFKQRVGQSPNEYRMMN